MEVSKASLAQLPPPGSVGNDGVLEWQCDKTILEEVREFTACKIDSDCSPRQYSIVRSAKELELSHSALRFHAASM